MTKIAVIGTLDTKGKELQFLADCIQRLEHRPLLIDLGATKPDSRYTPFLNRQQVAELAGLDPSAVYPDRQSAVEAMATASRKVLLHLLETRQIDGVISLGGESGTTIATEGMRALPLAFPKVMVSSVIGPKNAEYIEYRDIILFPSVTALSGLNRFLRHTLSLAAGAICGIAQAAISTSLSDKPVVLASRHNQLSAGLDRAVAVIEGAGYEVLQIEANGDGGKRIESMLDSHLAEGLLDICLREVTDETVPGGLFSAGPHRLESAARHGIPSVIVPGCVDIVTLEEDPKALAPLRERTFQKFNGEMRFMRSDAAECALVGRKIAEKVNASKGPVTVLLPLRGLSALSCPGKAFHDPEADRSLFKALKDNLQRKVHLKELRATINDNPFAEACARALLGNIKAKQRNHENLQKVDFFASESEPFLRDLAHRLETEVFLPGDFIIRQDEIGESMYFIANGSAEVILNGKRIAKLGHGAPFGEMALVSGARRVASIRALEYCEVHRLSKEDFDLLRQSNPTFDQRVKAIIKQRTLENLSY